MNALRRDEVLPVSSKTPLKHEGSLEVSIITTSTNADVRTELFGPA